MSMTAERLRKVLNYNPHTGQFTWLVRTARRIHIGDSPNCKNRDGYIQVSIDNKRYLVHRLVWLYVYDEWPLFQLDHVNGIRDDNRLCNLRSVTNSQNQQNRRGARCDSRTNVIGVTWVEKRQCWRAHLMLNRKYMLKSYHKKIEDAIASRRQAELKYHPFSSIHHKGITSCP